MNLFIENKLKIKPMSIEEMVLAADRLTRFKHPEIKYNRVFKEILSKYLLSPKISYTAYEKLSKEQIKEIVEQIFKNSVKKFIDNAPDKSVLLEKIINIELNIYNIDEETKKLMETEIPYEAILELSKQIPQSNNYCFENAKNIHFLKFLSLKNMTPEKARNRHLTKFPIEKVVLAEGITEEILLPKFAQILNYNFDKYGVEIIAAGGKNQVAKEYLKLIKQLKIPIVILLDADAEAIAQKISSRLRIQDKLILIEKGEFEDILPLKLIKKAINEKYRNFFKISVSDLTENTGRVEDLEELYRINGLGEFKKAEFAHNIDTVLDMDSKNFVSPEICKIISEIKKL